MPNRENTTVISVADESSQLASRPQFMSLWAEFEPRVWARWPSRAGLTSLSPDPRLELGLYDTMYDASSAALSLETSRAGTEQPSGLKLEASTQRQAQPLTLSNTVQMPIPSHLSHLESGSRTALIY